MPAPPHSAAFASAASPPTAGRAATALTTSNARVIGSDPGRRDTQRTSMPTTLSSASRSRTRFGSTLSLSAIGASERRIVRMSTSGSYLTRISGPPAAGAAVEVDSEDMALVTPVCDHDPKHAAAELGHGARVARDARLRGRLRPFGLDRHALDPRRVQPPVGDLTQGVPPHDESHSRQQSALAGEREV